jgi:hypothetical protein
MRDPGDLNRDRSDGSGCTTRAVGCPRTCAHIDVGHRPEVPKGVTLPALWGRLGLCLRTTKASPWRRHSTERRSCISQLGGKSAACWEATFPAQ